MSRSVTRRTYSSNTRYNFLFVFDKTKLLSNWQNIITRTFDNQFFVIFTDVQSSQVRRGEPKIPFIFPHNIASVGERRFSFSVDVSPDMVRVSMRKNHNVDVLRHTSFGSQGRDQIAGSWFQVAFTRVHQNSMLTSVNKKT